MRKQVNIKGFVVMVVLTSIFVQFVYPAQETILEYIINRLLVFSFIDITILIYYKLKLKDFLSTFKYIVLSMCVTIILESASILPFVYFLDLDMNVVRSSIYTLLVLSFPTRMIEYSALYLYYDRRKKKDEKTNRIN
jgi:hypothetical protein